MTKPDKLDLVEMRANEIEERLSDMLDGKPNAEVVNALLTIAARLLVRSAILNNRATIEHMCDGINLVTKFLAVSTVNEATKQGIKE